MKNLLLKTTSIIFILLIMLSHDTLLADDHDHGGEHSEEEEHETSKFGPSKAILEVKDEGQKFKLSHIAEQTMGIQFSTVTATEVKHKFRVPQGSLVEYQDKTGIYIKREGWYELINAKLLQSSKNSFLIYSKTLSANEKIVSAGLGLLRVAHLEASGHGGEGHAH